MLYRGDLMENFLFGIINTALSFIFYGFAIIFIYRLGFNDAMSVKNGDKELKNVLDNYHSSAIPFRQKVFLMLMKMDCSLAIYLICRVFK